MSRLTMHCHANTSIHFSSVVLVPGKQLESSDHKFPRTDASADWPMEVFNFMTSGL